MIPHNKLLLGIYFVRLLLVESATKRMFNHFQLATARQNNTENNSVSITYHLDDQTLERDARCVPGRERSSRQTIE